jgi:hypothetical protein
LAHRASLVSLARLSGLALLSGAGLVLEISLTRLFSTLFYPPYVFAILSLALLGIGLGGAAATWRASWRRDDYAPVYAALAGLGTLVLVVFAVLTAAHNLQIPLLVLVVWPYVCIGLALATLFSTHAAASPQLYLADLAGAGLGAMSAIPMLNAWGAINAVLVAACLLGLAGLALRPRALPHIPVSMLLVACFALGSNLAPGWLRLDMASLATQKPITESLVPSGRLVRTVWDSFARTDLVAPADGGAYRLYMDGAAGSVMPPAEDNDFLLRDIGFFPFATDQPRRVFIIGPGGGLDVWFGLKSGAQEIVGVEVNPASVALVEAFARYNGNLYGQPAVHVVVDEGRSALRRSALGHPGADYDLISLGQVVTLAAERSGYALTENTVYTVEAFEDYLAHLSPDGQIALKLYDELTLTRALSTALAALRRQGLSDAQALHHVAAFLDPSAQPPVPLLLIRKTAYTQEDALALGAVAQRVGFVPLFLPEVWAEPPLDSVQAGTITFNAIVERSESDVSPTSDDRPFFYQFERGIPQSLAPLLWALAGIVVTGAGLLAYAQRQVTPSRLRWAPLYFATLGVGFISIETAIIQQTRSFLGHPTLAVTTVLAVLLIGGGLGSGLAGRWPARPATYPALGVALLALVWLTAWPLLSQGLLVAPLLPRMLVVVASLSPLAVLMGMPFPLGLRAVSHAGERHVALAWAVNGVMSVVGSAGAVTLAILAGFSRVLLLGLVAYALAALLARLSLGKEGSLDAQDKRTAPA